VLTLKLDLHVHTVNSKDARIRVDDLPSIINSKGLDGVAVTEHDYFNPPDLKTALIVPGVEITSRDGHVIGLGIKESIPARLSAEETIRRIHSQGGVAIIPHPYDPVSERIRIGQLNERPDAVETVNADALSFRISNWLARRDAKRYSLPEVGGSDSHIPETVGDAYTIIMSESVSIDDIIAAVRAGRVSAGGHPTSVRNKLRKLKRRFH